MLSDYTFLTDHSYSLRPVVDDNDELSLNQREEKVKKRGKSSPRTNKATSTTNRTVSIDRSSSDKENNSLILSNSTDVPMSSTTSSVNKNARSNKKKPIGSRRSRLSTRTVIINSRTQSAKKQDNKTSSKIGVKSTQGSIVKKKKTINSGKTKLLNVSQIDSHDVLPSSSIEERVKLRRTKPPQPSATIVEPKPSKITKSPPRTTKVHSVEPDIKRIRQSKKEKILKPTKTNKFFLGSGLDLDNIVLGNRQRRGVQA